VMEMAAVGAAAAAGAPVDEGDVMGIACAGEVGGASTITALTPVEGPSEMASRKTRGASAWSSLLIIAW